MIWFKNYSLSDANSRGEKTLVENLGIVIDELGPNFIKGRMPVDERTKQPIGLLHGGASVAFAETLCSLAANLCVDPAQFYCVGLEINANHIGSAREGEVTGLARPLHQGKTTQVWETTISNGTKLVCVSRMTLAVLRKTNSV